MNGIKIFVIKAKSVETLNPLILSTINSDLLEKSIFQCKPSLMLLKSHYPLAAIEHCITEKTDDLSDLKIESSYCVLIQNKEFYPMTYWVKKDFFNFLNELKSGKLLQEVAEICFDSNENFCLTTNLALCFELGILENIVTE